MAFFRCGGSGIPASLKSGMNSVLNKKFGTSTTYDPAGWPADVNLLGPLPIKTASGAIAHIEDGADGVPVKSCVVSFLPSGGGGTPSAPVAITGVSGLSVTRTGKNWTDLSTYTDGFVKSNGQIDTAHTKGEMYSVFIPVPPNTAFHFEIVETSGTEDAWVGVGQYREANYSSFIKRSGYWNFTTDAECHYIVVSSRNLSTATKIQLETGSTATTYSAYVTPSVVTDTFGQTIYGGTRDLTTDKASVTWGYIASYNGETLTGRWISSMDTYVAGTTPTTGAEVAYELATPTEITGLTPHEIDTLYGDNNIYSDTGTMSVEYRADIDLALNA